MNEKRVTSVDFEAPQGEHKRIVAAMRSFGARNHVNVTTKMELTRDNLVKVTWSSDGGHYSERAWVVTTLFDEQLHSPDSMFRVDVTGSDDEWYTYHLPRPYLDRYLGQRLGNDYIPTLMDLAPKLYMELGGSRQGEYWTLPINMQYAVGQVAFQFFRERIQSL